MRQLAKVAMLLLLCPVIATAANVTVNCNPTSSAGKISNVLRTLDPLGPNTITVIGTCNDNIVIDGFDRLSLIAKPGAIVADASGGQGAVIQITDSRRIVIQGFTIHGGTIGVMCYDHSLCRFKGNTIDSTSFRAVDVGGSEATFDGDSLSNNFGDGLYLSSSNVFSSNMVIQNNSKTGILASAGVLVGVSLNVSNNQNNGVFGGTSVHIQLINSQVKDNGWNGIQIVGLSDVSLEDDVVTGNFYQGLWLANLANAWLSGGTYTGNTGHPDIGCYGQYTLAGNLSGTSYGSTNCISPEAAAASVK